MKACFHTVLYYYHSPRKPTVTFNFAFLFFFYKQAGGKFLKQSECLDVSSKNVYRRSLRCNSVRDYLLSVFFHQKGSKFAFKVAHSSGYGDKLRPEEEGRLLWIQKCKAVFYLFWFFDLFLSNLLYYSHWWTQQACWNVLVFVFSFFFFFPNFA